MEHEERLKAALADRYRIEREIGSGGMATVYLAQDLKHHRKVALKVLKPELAAVMGTERFLAEIRTTANLTHPHILPLHDSGEADGFLFYVMPYVEGESLRQKLDRYSQLSVEEAVRVAGHVAEALDHAHRQGVIHRDVKPSNILFEDDQPVVTDFGIALAVSAAGEGRLTETGLSLGTPYYMSPEQATGEQRVGPPSDTFALACVLYEALVGEPPFPGATAQAVLGKIIAGKAISATEHRPAIPTNVDAALRRALEKLPADRFPSVQDFAKALADPGFTYRGAGAAGAVESRSANVWKVAAVLFGISTVALAVSKVRGRPEEPAGVIRYELLLPTEVGANTDFGSNIAISPDGKRIVYSGMPVGAEAPGLWVRDRNRLEPVELPGTAFGVHPTFSPDGTEVAFIGDDRTLKVVSLDGRPPVTLHEGPWLRRAGLSWGEDGYIYFAQWVQEGGPSALHRIPETGGDTQIITAADTSRVEVAHYFPDIIPGSELVLLTVARESEYDADTRDVAVANIRTGEVHILLQGIQAVWSESGHILAVRGDGALVSAAFDPETLEVGPAIPVLEGVQVESLASVDLAISDNGTLVYGAGEALAGLGALRLLVVQFTGETSTLPLAPRFFLTPRWSPDGRIIAYGSGGVNAFNIFTFDVELGKAPRQLTFEGNNQDPVWSPDGSRIAFNSIRDGTDETDLFVKAVDDDTPASLLLSQPGPQTSRDWPSEGLVLFESGDGVNTDLWMTVPGEAGEAKPYLESGADLDDVVVSPDGRWAAYQSDETGTEEVYVRRFPEPRQQIPISAGGGQFPRWGKDGRTLYYWHAAAAVIDTLYAARLQTEPTLTVLSREPVLVGSYEVEGWDLHPDEDRIVVAQAVAYRDPAGIPVSDRFVVVVNWFEELKARLGR